MTTEIQLTKSNKQNICTECSKELTDEIYFNCTICNPNNIDNGEED